MAARSSALGTMDFNPRSPHGERRPCSRQRAGRCNFNPRSPHGERHRAVGGSVSTIGFQSTLPARGATSWSLTALKSTAISIHAPRTGSDVHRVLILLTENISIHAPRTGSDRQRPKKKIKKILFQSTLPARGATGGGKMMEQTENFNPRSPHGERRPLPTFPAAAAAYFNPRSPHGERHLQRLGQFNRPAISIHAPRTGSDCADACGSSRHKISIHAPRTGSDVWRWRCTAQNNISIHAPRTGSDCIPADVARRSTRFQSTLPARGATK